MSNHLGARLLTAHVWGRDQLEADREYALAAFRQGRLQEPAEPYLQAFAAAWSAMDRLLQLTENLLQIRSRIAMVLREPALREAFCYLAAPPMSEDDLIGLAGTRLRYRAALEQDPDLMWQVGQMILVRLDRRRFPWVTEGREPAQAERDAAILAAAVLIATRRVERSRHTQGKKALEEHVRHALASSGLQEIPVAAHGIYMAHEAPPPGAFCPAVMLGPRKVDFVLRLSDERIMTLECSLSHSAPNAIMHLNNAAVAKAAAWRGHFGTTQVVPVAVLSGVFKLGNLEDAQARGLTLYWAHRLDDLTRWIASTHVGQR